MNHKRWKLDHQSCLRNVQSCSGGKKLLVSKLEKKVANSTIKTCPTPVCVIIMYIIVYSYTCLLLLITDVERKKNINPNPFCIWWTKFFVCHHVLLGRLLQLLCRRNFLPHWFFAIEQLFRHTSNWFTCRKTTLTINHSHSILDMK